MKNKKPIIALGALAVVGLIAGTIAYFTSEVEFDNVFTTATYKTKSTEVFNSPQNWTPGETTEKTVTTLNEGTIPVAVRVLMTESWTKEDGTAFTPQELATVVSNIPQGSANTTDIAIINTSNVGTGAGKWTQWTYDGTTAYYYNTSLKPNATTSSVIASVTLNPDLKTKQTINTSTEGSVTTKTATTTIDGLGKATYTLTITVETVQFDQYKAVWFPGAAAGEAFEIVAAE